MGREQSFVFRRFVDFLFFQRVSVGAEGGRLLVREPPRFLFHIARNQFVNNVNPRRKRPSGIPSRALARVFKSGMAAGGGGEDRRTRRSDRGVTDGNEKGRGRGTRDRRLSQLWELNACMKRWIISEKGFAAESLSLSPTVLSRTAIRRERIETQPCTVCKTVFSQLEIASTSSPKFSLFLETLFELLYLFFSP